MRELLTPFRTLIIMTMPQFFFSHHHHHHHHYKITWDFYSEKPWCVLWYEQFHMRLSRRTPWQQRQSEKTLIFSNSDPLFASSLNRISLNGINQSLFLFRLDMFPYAKLLWVVCGRAWWRWSSQCSSWLGNLADKQDTLRFFQANRNYWYPSHIYAQRHTADVFGVGE